VDSPELPIAKLTLAAGGRLGALLDLLDRAALAIAGAALIGMAAVQGWQVFARYALNDSPSWTEPVALLLMSTSMMFGAAVGVRAHRHFGFFILVEHAPPVLRHVLLGCSQLLAAAIGLMLAAWGARMLADAWDYPIAGAALPQGIVFAPLCIGGALIAIFALERLFAPAPQVG
jgi:TRAP-type C4-dicarboxylate transport system permease small subunit